MLEDLVLYICVTTVVIYGIVTRVKRRNFIGLTLFCLLRFGCELAVTRRAKLVSV